MSRSSTNPAHSSPADHAPDAPPERAPEPAAPVDEPPDESAPGTVVDDELTTVDKLRGLPWAFAGGAANIIFVKLTFFGSVFVLFLNTLGMSKTQIGFLLSLIPYFGLVALFAAPFVARWGYKRSFITFWSLRQVGTFGVLLTPVIAATLGMQAMFGFITLIIIIFALCRALGETAWMPWRQEYIPNSIRGKFAAKDTIFTTIAGFAAVLGSGLVIQRTAGLGGYMTLFVVGGAFGLLGVWFFSHIPGGKPVAKSAQEPSIWRGMVGALQDRNFLRFMAGVSLIIVAAQPINAFVPLYMEEQVGISAGSVILLQMGTLGGSLLSSYLWGWSADRYGSKPAMMFSIFWRILLPVVFMLTPRNSPLSLGWALGASALQGMIDVGWAIGSARLLFVGVVPTEKKSEYMALHYAWVGLIGGSSQLLAGRLVDASSAVAGQWGSFTLDQYTPLFMLSVIAAAGSVLFFANVRADARYGVGEFAGMFLRGNPLLAVSSMVRYQFAKDEHAAILVTEQLGAAKSPLAVDELLESLKDPRFNVRLEALIAMARTKPDPRLTEALIETMNGTELALSAMAAWALGRMGDSSVIPQLHNALESPYRSIQAQGVRALGALGDEESIPILLERLRAEEDKGLQMAYASSLGKLGAVHATSDLLALLREFENEGARLELALALSRLLGDEHYFVQLVRQVRSDPGTAMAQTLSALKKELQPVIEEGSELAELVDRCTSALAHEDVSAGAALLGDIVEKLPREHFSPTGATILTECTWALRTFGDRHIEYIILALHTLHVDFIR